MFCVLSIWKLFMTSFDPQDLKWSYEQGNKLMVTCSWPHVLDVTLVKVASSVSTCAHTPKLTLLDLNGRETDALNGSWPGWPRVHGWNNSTSYRGTQVEMYVKSTRSREMGKRLLSRTPQLSKILAMPTACQPVFVKPPEHGLPSWDGLMHLPGRNYKWNFIDITEKHLNKKSHCENYSVLKNGQPTQFLHAPTAWTSSVLLPGHTDMSIQGISNAKEYEMQGTKCKGN